MAVERGVNAAEEEPARPQVLQSEFKDKICEQNQRPHHHKLQDGVGTEKKNKNKQKSIQWLHLKHQQTWVEFGYVRYIIDSSKETQVKALIRERLHNCN